MNPYEIESDRSPTDLPDALKQNLVGYRVLTPQDLVVGRVEEVVVDRNRHLYLAVSRSADATGDSSLVWLPGQYIQTVEPSQKALYVKLSHTEIEGLPPYSKKTEEDVTAPATTPRVDEKHNISLLEERLVVKRHRQKIGEVVVRKEVETRIVEVPLRSEKLIIERVGSETQRLAEIELGREEIAGLDESLGVVRDGHYPVSAEFSSPQAAAEALAAIARYQHNGNVRVRVELVVDSPEAQQKYKEMLH
ncbi:DUF2382 domain-containing protein [Oscillatoria sp. FACHB-1406]|uniref:DUF2382 domain-containing protein n=1 Tax=Oscillatoria sp. FACHB-1406 TaxID=2692846 RepID=UPI001687CD1E|nr:DUF2382 domain-containing protein [Oscillatoria sp. FACHB-1406]MBD2580644.1 DUF2382 domain-containing protein [Oscillatoria sp. FACHB-1406]